MSATARSTLIGKKFGKPCVCQTACLGFFGHRVHGGREAVPRYSPESLVLFHRQHHGDASTVLGYPYRSTLRCIEQLTETVLGIPGGDLFHASHVSYNGSAVNMPHRELPMSLAPEPYRVGHLQGCRQGVASGVDANRVVVDRGAKGAHHALPSRDIEGIAFVAKLQLA